MVGAHIDSGSARPAPTTTRPATASSMEIARVVSKPPLDKEIRIGGFGGEEDGLTGSLALRRNTLPAEERARFVGEWQMDMVGTPHAPATAVGAPRRTAARTSSSTRPTTPAARFGFTGLQTCKLGQSDHQAFFDVGIPSALFIWLDYHYPVAPATCESIGQRLIYDRARVPPARRDGMNNVSPERLQTTLDVVGGAFAHNALNSVQVTATRGRPPAADGEPHGQLRRRPAGYRRPRRERDAHAPSSRTRRATSRSRPQRGGSKIEDFAVFGDKALSATLRRRQRRAAPVGATLSLTLGTPASFGAFTPGITKTYDGGHDRQRDLDRGRRAR